MLKDFIRESNLIEGITRPPTEAEVLAAASFMVLPKVTVDDLNRFQEIVAPDMPLRDKDGLNVRVGDYTAPEGGPSIRRALENLVKRVNDSVDPKAHHSLKMNGSPWELHCAFETLHPYCDGNGRTGRILWAWQMERLGWRAFALPFLHQWYYQTLNASHS